MGLAKKTRGSGISRDVKTVDEYGYLETGKASRARNCHAAWRGNGLDLDKAAKAIDISR
jgi:hypothetical protein